MLVDYNLNNEIAQPGFKPEELEEGYKSNEDIL